ncbi:hypothetical protein N5P37_006563 [Trichoderma harzianum]|nr:hypothetical protein N5P37_006563 [Trichoderma harzianum]
MTYCLAVAAMPSSLALMPLLLPPCTGSFIYIIFEKLNAGEAFSKDDVYLRWWLVKPLLRRLSLGLAEVILKPRPRPHPGNFVTVGERFPVTAKYAGY